jgi:hypothetical protein
VSRTWYVTPEDYRRIIRRHWLPQDRPFWAVYAGALPDRRDARRIEVPGAARAINNVGMVSLRRVARYGREWWLSQMPRRSRCYWCHKPYSRWNPRLRSWVNKAVGSSRSYCDASYCEFLEAVCFELGRDCERVAEATRAVFQARQEAQWRKEWRQRQYLKNGKATLLRMRWLLRHPEALQSLRTESARAETSRD